MTSIQSSAVSVTEELAAVELPFSHRVRHGVRKPANWMQFVRFAAVGASGYVVNLVAFAIWLTSFGRNSIRWRGADYYIRDGRLVPARGDVTSP